MATRDRTVWTRIDGALKRLAPVFMLLLAVYLYASFVDPVVSKSTKRYLEVAVVGYFVVELAVKYAISEDLRSFLRSYWLDIVLLLPFFKALKLVGAVGKLLKSLRLLPYLRKAVKLPKMLRRTRSAVARAVSGGRDDGADAGSGDSEEPER